MPATEPDGVDAVGLDRLIAERRSKADALRTAGVEPFPNTFPGRRPIAEVRLQQATHGRLTEAVDRRPHLNAAVAILQVQERHLPLAASRGQASGDP